MHSWVKSHDYSSGENDRKIKIKKTEIGIESKNSNVKKNVKQELRKKLTIALELDFQFLIWLSQITCGTFQILNSNILGLKSHFVIFISRVN